MEGNHGDERVNDELQVHVHGVRTSLAVRASVVSHAFTGIATPRACAAVQAERDAVITQFRCAGTCRAVSNVATVASAGRTCRKTTKYFLSCSHIRQLI